MDRVRGQGAVVLAALILTGGACSRSAAGGHRAVNIAMAGNVAAPGAELVRRFTAITGFAVETSLGGTGQLYAQIMNGAPYDVFLAADTLRPRLLESSGWAAPGTRFTYAIGRLALYAPTWDGVDSGDLGRRYRSIGHLSIANPRTAPYGVAAQETLSRLGLWDSVRSRIIQGENVGQAFVFVESRAAEVGLVALSQVMDKDRHHYWVVPADLHEPIRQEAVLLRLGTDHAGAQAFVQFLRSDEARATLAEFGYALP